MTVLTRWKFVAAAAVFAALGMYSLQPPRPPRQPIAFPHTLHVQAGLRCMDCHRDAAVSPRASLPGTRECALCHGRIRADVPAVRQALAYARRGEEIPWQPVYGFLPSAQVRFRHDMHVKNGIACSSCHGDVGRETTARVSTPIGMGVCLGCHRRLRAPTECEACHY